MLKGLIYYYYSKVHKENYEGLAILNPPNRYVIRQWHHVICHNQVTILRSTHPDSLNEKCARAHVSRIVSPGLQVNNGAHRLLYIYCPFKCVVGRFDIFLWVIDREI